MSETLYLDTARLGLMSPSAQRLQTAFARYAGDPQSLLYFREFLRHGTPSLPDKLRGRHDPLGPWTGLDGLTRSVRWLTRAPVGAEVLFASRTATIMALATQSLIAACQRILTVDLLWPPYRRIVTAACRRAGLWMTGCQLRSASLNDNATSDQLAEIVVRTAVQYGCDGLVLPMLDHRGVTLPVGDIVRRLQAHGQGPSYVVVDASQALGHVPVSVEEMGGDFLIAGPHKWLGGCHPLGIGLSVGPAVRECGSLLRLDPMLRLSQEVAGAVSVRHGETAAVLPLLTAAGGIVDARKTVVTERLATRLANRVRLTAMLEGAGWRPIRSSTERHGILLARPPRALRRRGSQAVSRSLVAREVVVTVYASGLTRFSLPEATLSSDDLKRLRAALHQPCGISTVSTDAIRCGPVAPRDRSTSVVLSGRHDGFSPRPYDRC